MGILQDFREGREAAKNDPRQKANQYYRLRSMALSVVLSAGAALGLTHLNNQNNKGAQEAARTDTKALTASNNRLAAAIEQQNALAEAKMVEFSEPETVVASPAEQQSAPPTKASPDNNQQVVHGETPQAPDQERGQS